MERLSITNPDDKIGLLGILMGHFDNRTGLSDDEVSVRYFELTKEED